MKATLEVGSIEVYMLIPTLTFLYDPDYKKFEIGGYLFKFFLTINIKFK